MLRDMENLARGLRVEDFNFANRSTPLHFGGIRLNAPLRRIASSDPGLKLP